MCSATMGSMKHFLILSLVVFSGVFAAACQAPEQNNIAQPVEDTQLIIDETSTATNDPFIPALEAQLTDVTEGADLSDGINTAGAAVGVAQAGLLEDGTYLMNAEVVGLPELPEGYFYEGWLINSDVSPFSVISTGELDNEDGITYTNVFAAEEDFSDHLEYVITLEPRDGDPAPAEHVVSGTFQEV